MNYTFDHIDWTALGDMLKRMVNRSRDFYNLEIPSEDQHNLLFVAAFETISMLSQVSERHSGECTFAFSLPGEQL